VTLQLVGYILEYYFIRFTIYYLSPVFFVCVINLLVALVVSTGEMPACPSRLFPIQLTKTHCKGHAVQRGIQTFAPVFSEVSFSLLRPVNLFWPSVKCVIAAGNLNLRLYLYSKLPVPNLKIKYVHWFWLCY